MSDKKSPDTKGKAAAAETAAPVVSGTSSSPAATTAVGTPAKAPPKASGIKMTAVRISNFRSLKNVEVSLEDLTVLVGANNAGKTSFLDALQAAIGATRKLLSKEDIRLEDGETDVPKDRKAIIDVLLRPTDDTGKLADNFPAGSFWTGLWGDGISQSDPEFHDQVILRTTLAWSEIHGDYRTVRKFAKEWKPFADWLTSEEKGVVSALQIEPIALHYIDAKRDLDEDLRSRTSFWRRLTDELDLDPADIKKFEDVLTALNQDILGKSAVLQHLRDTLMGLQRVVASEKSSVDITPLPRRLRDLSRGVDVTLGAIGSQSFPLTRHGMGTRSLASLLVFRAFAAWKLERAAESDNLMHTLLGLEEPEAHLHPQAQRALFAQIRMIPGQRIVSTHSPYFAGQSALENIRLVTKAGGDTKVSALDLTNLTEDDRRKLDREVIASRGDLLFARAVILFEGETEEQALPIYAQKRWGSTVHELGFSFVGVGGGNYFPFVWLAKSFMIPWYILSDGEPKPVKTLETQLARAGFDDVSKCPNVVTIPNGNDYEAELIQDGYLDAIEAAVTKVHGATELNDYIKNLDGTAGKKVDGVPTTRNYSGADGRKAAALDMIRERKTRLAAPIAYAITELADAKRHVPKSVSALFDKVAKDFALK